MRSIGSTWFAAETPHEPAGNTGHALVAPDEEKLANSEVAYPYLVHFERERYPDSRVDRILFQPSRNIRTIFVRLLRGEACYKMISDTGFQSKKLAACP